MKKARIKKIALCALFTAVITACAWLSIPTPFGINLAFTLFGISLAGFLLGVKGATAAVAVYIALGAAGLPVFSNFTGGIGILFGVSGGFLWGFLLTAVLCGIASKASKKLLKYTFMILSVLLCHMVGITQYCIVTGNNVLAAFLTASLPFLLKDIILLFLAELISKKIKIKGVLT